MNTKDFLSLGVPFGEPTRRGMDFVAKFILGGGPSRFQAVYRVRRRWVVR